MLYAVHYLLFRAILKVDTIIVLSLQMRKQREVIKLGPKTIEKGRGRKAV